jgi:hypothetical protein
MEDQSRLCQATRSNLTIGLDKADAQRKFIETAQDLGIPPVNWEDKIPSYRTPKRIDWNQPPRGLVTAVTSKGRCHASRKLLTRAADTLSPEPGVEKSCGNPIGLVLGSSFVSGMVLSLWATLGPLIDAERQSKESRRLHARSWKVNE